jgi:hypothetical protein
MKTTLLLAVAIALCALGASRAAHDEISEVGRSFDDLPQSVARVMRHHLGDRRASEIEEIRYEGLPILYEAEFEMDGLEHEIAVFPNGDLAHAGPEGDGDAADDGDDEDGDDDDADEEVTAREIGLDAMPAVAAASLLAAAGDGVIDEIEEISYEGIVVLYEAEIAGAGADDDDGDEDADGDDDEFEIYVYPDGTTAERSGEVTEREVAMRDLPASVARTIRREFGDRRPSEIHEVRYDGIPVLYEAEHEADGHEHEIAVYPGGRLAV